MILPGIYFAYNLYQKQEFYNKAEAFITEKFSKNDTILFQKINYANVRRTQHASGN